jgi:transposase-like protein
MEKIPETLLDVVQHFNDPRKCVEFVRDLHWPDGVVCPKCESKDVTELTTRQLWQCKNCQKQFSVKVGTIFESSGLSLSKWLTAMWLIANAKNGISSYEIHRSVGVTQKTAWFMLHRIREAMRNGSIMKLSGVVEADETYVGGLDKNRHADKRYNSMYIHGSKRRGDKTMVAGVLQRGGGVRARVVNSVKATDLAPILNENIEPGSTLYTDDLHSYRKFDKKRGGHFEHDSVNHAGEYVRGNVHTNNIENFWSLFKRCVKGTYIHVAPFHIERYLDEEGMRYEYRKGDDKARFEQLASRVFGRRLTWKELTAKEEE